MFFKNIEIDNFLSFGEGNEISFNSDNVTFIKGVNLDTNGSNGSGKSTLIEAIVWCLFGRTIRGATADDVVNYKNKKNTRVSIAIDDYLITRYRKHDEYDNTLIVKKNNEEMTLGTVRESTKVIEDIFNITYETFINSIVLGANVNVNFLSAGSNADRRKIFENLLDINNFADFQKECKEEEASIAIDIAELNTKRSSIQDFISNLIIKKSENESKIILWEEDRKCATFDLTVKLQNLKKIDLEKYRNAIEDRKKLLTEQDKIKSNLAPIMSLVKNTETHIKENTMLIENLDNIKSLDLNLFKEKYEEIKKTNEELSKLETIKIKIQSEININNTNLTSLSKDLEGVTKFLGEPCPTCGTLLDQDNLKKLSSSFHDKIVACEEKLESLNKKLGIADDKITELKKEIKENTPSISEVQISIYEEKLEQYPDIRAKLDKQIAENEKNVESLKKSKSDLESINEKINNIKIEKTEDEIRSIENSIVDAANKIDLKQKEENPYKNIDVQSEIDEYIKKIEELDKLINTQQEDMKYWTFWKDAFGNKGLKIHIFDSVIPFFNNRIQFYLDILSSGKFGLVFDKDLSYEIDGTKYNNSSSGEKKRIDLAVMIALFDLLNLRTSSSSNILILDEVLDSLDEIGVESVQDLLIELNKRIKNIFIISHNNNLSENFSNVLNVVKEDGISQIIN